MRLLHAKELYLKEFFDAEIPPYAILSHTWGDEEISYQDFLAIRKLQDERYAAYHELIRLDLTRSTESSGYTKIEACCRLAASKGHEWVWIDTCCIDKTSSAELQEAINSMYKWYERAEVCYAYLSDVQAGLPQDKSLEDDSLEYWLLRDSSLKDELLSEFRVSRWFTRGWTLQELIAPSVIEFIDSSWRRFGSKKSLATEISAITIIPAKLLESVLFPWQFCVATRMSWAANRRTTRIEDIGYCLLGLFAIQMPLIYGEGHNAFRRLQEEIVRTDDDETIFAHNGHAPFQVGLLAPSPSSFTIRKVQFDNRFENAPPRSHTITNRGLRMEVHVLEIENTVLANKRWQLALRRRELHDSPHCLLPLRCASTRTSPSRQIALVASRSSQGNQVWSVLACVDLSAADLTSIIRPTNFKTSSKTIYVELQPLLFEAHQEA
jgi:hypothetical protein